MACNTSVSGSRWRCPACETFLSYQDLQLCGLTQAALKKFEREVSSTRDRVEFKADKTYKLLPEPKLRYGTKKRTSATSGNGNNNNTTSTKMDPDTIEIIDLD
jgi:hypothetical protein